jgi:hypothetical protein
MKKFVAALACLLAVLTVAHAGLINVSGGSTYVSTSGGGDAEADWISRRDGPGILNHTRFDNQSELDAVIWPDDQQDGWSLSTDRPSGTYSARVEVEDDDTTNNGALTIPLAPDERVFGPAQTDKEYFVQFRQKGPASFVYAAYPGDGGNAPFANGQKHIILSHGSGSFQNNEVVIEDSYQMGGPTWYWNNNSSSFHTNNPYVSSVNGFRLQEQIDNGGPESTAAEVRARYGLVTINGTDRHTGTPILPQGGFYYLPDEWMTFEVRVDFSAGFANTIIEMWAAHEGEAPVKFVSSTVDIGTANGGHNMAWLTTYTSERTSNGGFDTYTLYSEFLSGTEPIPFPGGYTITVADNPPRNTRDSMFAGRAANADHFEMFTGLAANADDFEYRLAVGQ